MIKNCFKFLRDVSPTIKEFEIDPSVNADVLKELVYFAYHRRCTLNQLISLQMADFANKYMVTPLLDYTLEYLVQNCNIFNAIRGFELCSSWQRSSKLFFKKFIEDNFEIVNSNLGSFLFSNLILFFCRLSNKTVKIYFHLNSSSFWIYSNRQSWIWSTRRLFGLWSKTGWHSRRTAVRFTSRFSSKNHFELVDFERISSRKTSSPVRFFLPNPPMFSWRFRLLSTSCWMKADWSSKVRIRNHPYEW